MRTSPTASASAARPGAPEHHLGCPFCGSYGVARLFLASVRLDSCECTACGARWDEDPLTGAYCGRSTRESVVMPRERP